MPTREELQTELNARISELRERANAKQAAADALDNSITHDIAFWTQPASGNSRGRAFARRRDKERSKIEKIFSISAEARALRDQADSMERRGVVMAGDAAAAREAKIAALQVQLGQMVDTTHYGVRKVIKINTKTICVESAFGSLKVNKEFVRSVQP